MTNYIEIWTGRATSYDTYRPQPPTVILDLFTQLIGDPHPQLVVDLGSGTGLSTTVWAERAQQVIGIEPNDDMRRLAETKLQQGSLQNVSFQSGVSTQTGLPSGCADIVACSQSLHWMEPEPTFAEIERILRPGGLFAAYDYSWPPTVHWEADLAYQELIARVDLATVEQGLQQGGGMWEKNQHLARMQASGRFRWVKKVLLHHMEIGNAERFIGLTMSNYIAELLASGLEQKAIGLDRFTATVHQALGDKVVPFYFSYRVRIGIK